MDNTRLMRMAGRFSRRVRAFAKAHHIPIIDCSQGQQKHQIAEQHLAQNPTVRGLFLILVARALAPVWDVQRSAQGTLRNITAKRVYVNHYSFHIWDPQCGHSTIKLSGHPPFPAQILLNGHEFLACQARKAGLEFHKDGNCFTQVAQPADLERVADTWSDPRTIGRLIQVCEGWIYTCCLCFALDSAEQERTGFRYAYSVYQVEYSQNLLFARGGQMDQVFQGLIDRTRAHLDVRQLRTLFGAHRRPHYRPRRDRKASSVPRVSSCGRETYV